MTRTLLVANPTAHSGKAEARIKATLRAIKARGVRVDFIPTRPQGRTVPEIAEALKGGKYSAAIYMGGDGTFAEVAQGIMASGTRTPMGMMPSGTANDQGRSFGVRASEDALQENLDIIEAGYTIGLDGGRLSRLTSQGLVMGEVVFFDSAGWGIQSDILIQRNREKQIVEEIPILRSIYKDKAVYAKAAIGQLINSYVDPISFKATVVTNDGQVRHIEGLTDIVIKGTAIYGGSWVLARHSEPDDGLFEFIPIQGRLDWASKALRDLAAIPIWQEHLDLVGVTHSEGFSASSFDMTLEREGNRPVPSQIDGEEWLPGRRFKVEVIPSAIDLIVPRHFSPPWKIDRI